MGTQQHKDITVNFGIFDNDGNGLVDGVNTYQLFDSGSAIDLHIGDGRATVRS